MKQVRKNEPEIFCTSFKKRVGKSILTFRTKNLVNFFFEGFRSTLKISNNANANLPLKNVSPWCSLIYVFPIDNDSSFEFGWFCTLQRLSSRMYITGAHMLCCLSAAPPHQLFMFLTGVCISQKYLHIIQYKNSKCFSKVFKVQDFKLQHLILRTTLGGTDFISQHCWVVELILTKLVRRKCFVPDLYQLRKGKGAGLALKYLYMIQGRARDGTKPGLNNFLYKKSLLGCEMTKFSSNCAQIQVGCLFWGWQ